MAPPCFVHTVEFTKGGDNQIDGDAKTKSTITMSAICVIVTVIFL